MKLYILRLFVCFHVSKSYKWAISWAIVNAVANPLSRTTAHFDVPLHIVPNSVNPNVSHLLSVTFFARLLHKGVLKTKQKSSWKKDFLLRKNSNLVSSTAASYSSLLDSFCHLQNLLNISAASSLALIYS
jgi:hypothetical protein